MFDGRGDVCFFVPSHCRILFHQQPAHRSRSSNHQAFHNVSWRTFSVRKKQGVANWFNNWSTGWRQWRLLKSLLQYIIQNMYVHSNIQGENMENSLLSSLCPVGCFTLLFLKKRKRKAPRFITCVQSYLEGEWTGIRSHIAVLVFVLVLVSEGPRYFSTMTLPPLNPGYHRHVIQHRTCAHTDRFRHKAVPVSLSVYRHCSLHRH